MTGIKTYILSEIAEQDISDIYDYTLSAHGPLQATEYLTGLDEVFGIIIEQPTLGRRRAEIREGLHSHAFKEHVIFYRIAETHIRIVRVLHSRRDMPKHF